MKRVLIFIAALVICAVTFTACGKSDEQVLNEEAIAVYNIVKKYGIEKPVSSRYAYSFSLDTENISETLSSELICELNEHFGENKGDYRISIVLDSDGALDKVKLWFKEDFDEAWANGDYNAEKIICGEYSE